MKEEGDRTILQFACEYPALRVIEALFERNADIDTQYFEVRGSGLYTHVCSINNGLSCLGSLADIGWAQGEYQRKGQRERTAWTLAKVLGRDIAVSFLVASGADTSIGCEHAQLVIGPQYSDDLLLSTHRPGLKVFFINPMRSRPRLTTD